MDNVEARAALAGSARGEIMPQARDRARKADSRRAISEDSGASESLSCIIKALVFVSTEWRVLLNGERHTPDPIGIWRKTWGIILSGGLGRTPLDHTLLAS